MTWNRLLGVFFALVLIDGALRKWVFPGQASLLYFLKDAVLVVAFGLFWLRHETRLPERVRGSFVAVSLGAYVLAVALQSLNPRAPNFAVSLLGAKSHLLYILLLVLVPAALQDETDSVRWARRYAVFAVVPISLLAVYQFFLPPTHWLNQYLSEAAVTDVATAGDLGATRVTGTFSYITGMATFATFNLGLAVGLLVAGLREGGRSLWVGTGVLVLTLVVAPMTGSRGALYLPALALPIVVFSLAGRGVLNGRAIWLAVLAFGLWTLLSTAGAMAGWTTFLERATAAGDERSRADDTLFGPIEKLDEAGFLGYGTGTTHQAAPQLVPGVQPYSWLPDLYFEEENGRIGLELGILGFLAYLAVKLSLCAVAIGVVRDARSEAEIVWGVTGTVFLISHLIAGTVFNPTAAAFYWGLAGIILAMWSDQRAVRASQSNQPGRLVPASAG